LNDLFLTPEQSLEQVQAGVSTAIPATHDATTESTLGRTFKPRKVKQAPTRNHYECIPETIFYLVLKVSKGGNISVEDSHILGLIAGSYGESQNGFIHLVDRTKAYFAELLRTAKYLTEDPTDKSQKKSLDYLDEALDLLIEFPFLMTPANVTALDALLFEKGAIVRTMNRFQDACIRETGFDFTKLNEGRWVTEEDGSELVA
jgi:hypothetical protein